MSEGSDIRITLELQDAYTFRVSFDGTDLDPLTTDEPPPLGGDHGPNPSRLLLTAVANCLSASLLFAMRKFKNEPGPIRTVVTGRAERNAEGRWRIPKAWVEINLAEGAGTHEKLERILETFENYCVVTQSVRQGIEVDVTVKDGDGRILLGDKSFEAGA
jgi:uncharacterized OsmC-like protein